MAQFESMTLPPRLPLVVTTQNRNSSFTKDARLVNCYIETDDQGELWVYKRPGYEAAFSVGASSGRGVYKWQGVTYSIFAGQLYADGVAISGADGLDQTNGVYRFSAIKGAVPKMVFGNGKKTYAYDPVGGLTSDLHSIDEDFPEEAVKGIAYLNGATYVMQEDGTIWGSAINSVSVDGDWNPLNFIDAQSEPDNGVALEKQLVYIIALGEWTTDVFYDAGNPQGSPLAPVQGSTISYGCQNADSVQRIDDQLFWLSVTQTGTVQVSQIAQLNHQIISTKPIDRLLQGADTSVVYSWQIKLSGHSFYVLTLKNSNLTLAYDIVEGLWHQWTDTDGNYVPIVASASDSENRHIVQHESTGELFYMSADVYTDDDDRITVDIYTPIFDANTTRRKQMSSMRFVGDQQPGSLLYVRYSDNDYTDWSRFRVVDLSKRSPMLPNCGTFVRRSYHFRHTANTPLRLKAVDVQYDLGTL